MSNDDEKTAPGGLPVQPGPSQEMQMVASYNAMRSAYLQQVAKYEELIGRVAQLESTWKSAIDLIRCPPWLNDVMIAATSKSAVADIRGELTALRERVAELESHCETNHDPGSGPGPAVIPFSTG